MEFESIGKYVIKQEIGNTPAGGLYLGEDPKSHRTVLIRVVKRQALTGKGGMGTLDSFVSKALGATRLEHCNIAQVLAAGIDDDIGYIVWEHVTGERLRHEMDKRLEYDFPTAVELVRQLLSALTHAHEQEVPHTLIGPTRLVMQPDGSIKIAGFGLSGLILNASALHGLTLADPDYTTPEQLRGEVVDHRADIFAAGLLLYHLLSGRHAFAGENTEVIRDNMLNVPAPKISEKNPAIPTSLDPIILQALAKDPRERFQSAQEFAQALQRAVEVGVVTIAPTRQLEHQRVSRFEVLRERGRVYSGVLYDGRDPETGQSVLIRVVHKAALTGSHGMGTPESFLHDARAATRLEHLNIARPLEAGEEGGDCYIVWEQVAGPRLREDLDLGVEFELPVALELVRQLLSALEHAHALGVDHTLLGPSRLVIPPGGSVKIAGFGLSGFILNPAAAKGLAMADPDYTAPEQLRGDVVDRRADLYAVGLLLYQLVTGRHAFPADTAEQTHHQVLFGQVTPASGLNPLLPKSFDRVIEKALANDPTQRFQSALEFAGALRQAIETGEVEFQAPQEELAYQTIGDFRINAEAGKAVNGGLYEGHDPASGRQVLVRVVHRSALTGMGGMGIPELFLERARAAATLEHPNIARLLYAGGEDDFYYLVWEAVPGKRLRQDFDFSAQYDFKLATSLVAQLLAGLDYAHSQGVVHTLLGPSRVIVMPDGSAKISGFGLSGLITDPGAVSGLALADPEYTSPEQIKGMAPDARSDLFVVGMMLHQLLTGEHPFTASSQDGIVLNLLHVNAKSPADIDPSVPRSYDSVLQRALAKDPLRRFQNARSFLEALREAAKHAVIEVQGSRVNPNNTIFNMGSGTQGPANAVGSDTMAHVDAALGKQAAQAAQAASKAPAAAWSSSEDVGNATMMHLDRLISGLDQQRQKPSSSVPIAEDNNAVGDSTMLSIDRLLGELGKERKP